MLPNQRYEFRYELMALEIACDEASKESRVAFESDRTLAMHTAMISASMTAYSTAVGPSSSATNRPSCFWK
jgi:hypothetical protein